MRRLLNSPVMLPVGFLIVLFLFPLQLARATEQTGQCFEVGDRVTIRGRIQPGVKFGTNILLLKGLCVHYPKRTDHFRPLNVETIGEKLPPNVYLEVTGVLSDPWPIYGIAIKIVSYRNVDSEVRAALADWQRQCKRWQDENIPALVARTHGSAVGRINNDELGSLPGHQCAVWAVDTKLPHESVTIWRPDK